MHARLDEKQKEYVGKLEYYQSVYAEHQTKIKELEDDNYELRQKLSELQQQSEIGGIKSDEVKQRLEEMHLVEADLRSEREKNRKLYEEMFREKGTSMQLEIRLSDLERQNVDHKLRIGDLESKVEEYESHIQKLEVAATEQTFNNESDSSVRMNKMFGILNSLKNENLKINVDQVEALLKNWQQASRTNLEDAGLLKREISELRKQLKDLKQAYLAAVPNPSEEDLRSQSADGAVSSSNVAQQLLKKVLLYEEQNNLLKLEKKQIVESMMSANKTAIEHLNILYSIALDKSQPCK